jgi:hypothetical protein
MWGGDFEENDDDNRSPPRWFGRVVIAVYALMVTTWLGVFLWWCYRQFIGLFFGAN